MLCLGTKSVNHDKKSLPKSRLHAMHECGETSNLTRKVTQCPPCAGIVSERTKWLLPGRLLCWTQPQVLRALVSSGLVVYRNSGLSVVCEQRPLRGRCVFVDVGGDKLLDTYRHMFLRYVEPYCLQYFVISIFSLTRQRRILSRMFTAETRIHYFEEG